ncbi:RNA 2',3'-cyclic phosphodiesterase [Sphingomonas hengshuiensis]|uniref:RNA 2',3'-cyclic phosphodiesterase n=1 Tax=Sphingomonas hengshuiensis TaxID=1609977 RepID=A0A7U4JAE3_9SPHN|nr:RNA 2',3'-cyclic phosphodiesterase [Sphingomonas hengshuiensis]AJP73191.1 2'-5' RNA ligase [Sphingomonas hengshuiensis]
MLRIFAGLALPGQIMSSLLATMGGIPGARWQSAEQLHLTLRFIGDVDRRVAEDIALALGQVSVPPITIALSGVGQFESRGRPNAVWAGVRPQAPLAALHRKIDQAVVRCGLPPEGRAYLPHVTLARMNAASGATDLFLETHAGLASPPFTLDHFILFESRLGHGGASYTPVERYPLRG